jgi:hypothetical protein
MTETVSYQRSFTIAELAALLGTLPTRRHVLAAFDPANSTYGTRAEDDEALLDALILPGDPYRHLLAVTDRSWSVTEPRPDT